MAKGKRSKSKASKAKHVKVSASAGKRIKLSGKKYQCYAKRVKKGFGRKGMTTRAFCRKPPEAKK